MENHNLSTFGARLDDAIRRSGLTRDKLASALGLSKSAIASYCRDEREPKFEHLIAICKLVNSDCNYLMTGVTSEYSQINNTLGISQEAISTLSNLASQKALMCPGTTYTFSQVLSVLLSDDKTVRDIVEYLTIPDVPMKAHVHIADNPAILKNGTRLKYTEMIFYEDTEITFVEETVGAAVLYKSKVDEDLRRVRKNMHEELKKVYGTTSSRRKSFDAFTGQIIIQTHDENGNSTQRYVSRKEAQKKTEEDN